MGESEMIKETKKHYMTDAARKSAIKKLDNLIIDVATSDAIAEELGYTKAQDIVKFLASYQRIIESEVSSK